MVCCCVPGCYGHEASRKRGTKFHRFPRNPDLFQQWLAKIQHGNLLVGTPYSKLRTRRVCSKHFLESDYTLSSRLQKKLMPNESVRLVLKREALPSVFEFQQPPKRRLDKLRERETRLEATPVPRKRRIRRRKKIKHAAQTTARVSVSVSQLTIPDDCSESDGSLDLPLITIARRLRDAKVTGVMGEGRCHETTLEQENVAGPSSENFNEDCVKVPNVHCVPASDVDDDLGRAPNQRGETCFIKVEMFEDHDEIDNSIGNVSDQSGGITYVKEEINEDNYETNGTVSSCVRGQSGKSFYIKEEVCEDYNETNSNTVVGSVGSVGSDRFFVKEEVYEECEETNHTAGNVREHSGGRFYTAKEANENYDEPNNTVGSARDQSEERLFIKEEVNYDTVDSVSDQSGEGIYMEKELNENYDETCDTSSAMDQHGARFCIKEELSDDYDDTVGNVKNQSGGRFFIKKVVNEDYDETCNAVSSALDQSWKDCYVKLELNEDLGIYD